MNIRFSSGSKLIVSHTVPPPPASQYFPLGSQVLAARAIDSFSKGLDGIARHREPAPLLLARLGVVGGDVAAHAVLGAAVADDHVALEHARGAGDGVRARAVDDGVLLPRHRAGGRVQRDQPAVVGAHVDLALVEGDAAVDHVAAALVPGFLRHLGIVGPEALPGAGVHRVDHAPRRGHVHDAVHHQRRRLHAARGLEVVRPGEAQHLDVVRVDLAEAAEARLGVVQAVAQPVARLSRVGLDGGAVDLAGGGPDVVWGALGRGAALGEGPATDEAGEGEGRECRRRGYALHMPLLVEVAAPGLPGRSCQRAGARSTAPRLDWSTAARY